MQVVEAPGVAVQFASDSIIALRQQIALQTDIVTSVKAQVIQAEQLLTNLHDSLRRTEQHAREVDDARSVEEADEVFRKLVVRETQLAYVKRCWRYLVNHRVRRVRRDNARRSMIGYYNTWGRSLSYWDSIPYAEYWGAWNPRRHPAAQVIRAAHRCHYMGLLRHKIGSFGPIAHTYEDLELAHDAGERTLGKVNKNGDYGWHIRTVSPVMSTWPNEHAFSIDSGPKEHPDTFFAFDAGPSYD